jgi:hypothetical protein
MPPTANETAAAKSPSGLTPGSHDQRDEEKHQEHEKQNLRDLDSARGRDPKTKECGNSRNEEKDCSPFQHKDLLP